MFLILAQPEKINTDLISTSGSHFCLLLFIKKTSKSNSSTLARPSSPQKNHQATEARGATPIFPMHWFYQVERWWSCLLPFNNNRHAAVATAHLRSLETFRKQTEELSESPRNRQTGRPRAKPHDF